MSRLEGGAPRSPAISLERPSLSMRAVSLRSVHVEMSPRIPNAHTASKEPRIQIPNKYSPIQLNREQTPSAFNKMTAKRSEISSPFRHYFYKQESENMSLGPVRIDQKNIFRGFKEYTATVQNSDQSTQLSIKTPEGEQPKMKQVTIGMSNEAIQKVLTRKKLELANQPAQYTRNNVDKHEFLETKASQNPVESIHHPTDAPIPSVPTRRNENMQPQYSEYYHTGSTAGHQQHQEPRKVTNPDTNTPEPRFFTTLQSTKIPEYRPAREVEMVTSTTQTELVQPLNNKVPQLKENITVQVNDKNRVEEIKAELSTIDAEVNQRVIAPHQTEKPSVNTNGQREGNISSESAEKGSLHQKVKEKKAAGLSWMLLGIQRKKTVEYEEDPYAKSEREELIRVAAFRTFAKKTKGMYPKGMYPSGEEFAGNLPKNPPKGAISHIMIALGQFWDGSYTKLCEEIKQLGELKNVRQAIFLGSLINYVIRPLKRAWARVGVPASKQDLELVLSNNQDDAAAA